MDITSSMDLNSYLVFSEIRWTHWQDVPCSSLCRKSSMYSSMFKSSEEIELSSEICLDSAALMHFMPNDTS